MRRRESLASGNSGAEGGAWEEVFSREHEEPDKEGRWERAHVEYGWKCC